MPTNSAALHALTIPLLPPEQARLDALHHLNILDTPPEQEFDDITRLAAQICAAPIALVSLVDTDRQWFKSKVGIDTCETGRDISFCARAMHHSGLFVIADTQADPRFANNPLVTGEPFARFYAGAPLVTAAGQPLGTLCIIDQKPRTLTPAQSQGLLALARMVVSLLELRHTTAELRREADAREEAERIAREGRLRKDAMLTAALDCIITINDCEEVVDWNRAAEVTFGYSASEACGQPLSTLIIPPALRAAHKQGMAHFLKTGEGPVLNKRIEVHAIRKDGTGLPVELTVVPICLETGSLFMAAVRDISERTEAEDRLRRAHDDLRRANESLERRVRERTLSLAEAYDATIEGWSRALDLRDKETEGHCRRVTELTERLARAAGLSEATIVQVRRGALLHDIGKMGVPDQILLKPGPLTDTEWDIMRRHPTYAHDLLCPVEFLHPALDIPWCHHEKWDGTGYPQHLSGEAIPLTARLFAVADVWDALCSDRPYRAGWPQERVIAHIKSLSGTHFDPAVVQVFCAVMVEEEALRNLRFGKRKAA